MRVVYRVRRTVYVEGAWHDFWFPIAFRDMRDANSCRRHQIRHGKKFLKKWKKIMGVRRITVHIKPLEVV